MNLVGPAALGLALGVITGIPLGVINIAVVDAALARHRRYARGLGLGGALADAVHATLAVVGIGSLVTAEPALTRILAAIAAIAIVGFAVITWRRHRAGRTTGPDRDPLAVDDGPSLARGIPAGMMLTLPNPGALGAWVAVAAALLPHAQITGAIAFGLGVGLGSALWFTLLAHLAGKLRGDHPAFKRLPFVALAALVAIAIGGVVRVL